MRAERDTAIVGLVCAGVLALTYCASIAFRDVYDGAPRSIPLTGLAAVCDAAGGSCEATVVRLDGGRFYVQTQVPARSLTLTITDVAAVTAARVLLLRSEGGGRVTIGTNTPSIQIPMAASGPPLRSVIPLPTAAPWNEIAFVPASADRPLVLDEVGLFADDRGLLRSMRQPIPSIDGQRFYATYLAVVALALCALIFFATYRARELMSRVGPWVVAVLCLAICMLEIGTMFAPYWSRDLRSIYAAELVVAGSGGNLTGGPAEGAHLVRGLGQTIAPGVVQWHRMPGYGWFCALAAILGRTTDVIEIAMIAVALQVVLYSATVGVFVAVARRVFGLPIACLVGILIALLPKQLLYTEVDSIVAPIALLVVSALLWYFASADRTGPTPLSTFLLVNAAFALWFVMRTDVLPGWIVVSIALAGWRWRAVLVPAVLICAIAVPWALYKRQYRHEFDFMPTNMGEVLFLSLCEVPGAFPYSCTDGGYFEWAARAGHRDPVTQRASSLATSEVLRHWGTYPVHFGFMVWYKLRRAVFGESWPGFRTRLNFLYRGLVREVGLFAFLLTVLLVSLAVNHQRRRSLLLGWALFLNMPIFFLVFASTGRFYAAAGVSLLVVSVPLLFERDLYTQLRRHPWRAAAVIAGVLLFTAEGRRVEDVVLAHDALHYWAPVLDPSRSTLRFVGH
jgi:hypothetical protein